MLKLEWDAANKEHIARHNVTPEEAEQALINGPIELGHYFESGESRASLVGETKAGRVLHVVVTARGRALRVVTAHTANRRLRTVWRAYKDGHYE